MSPFLNKLYGILPYPIQNIGISAFGWKWNRRRFGGIFKAELSACKIREQFSTSQWKEYQTAQLRILLHHAASTVPYYTQLFNSLQLDVDALSQMTLDDLIKIPVLEKNALREYGETTLISRRLEPKGEFYASSGSTGTPTQILFSAPMHQRWSALFEARIRHWAGLSIHDARGMIGGRRIIQDAVGHVPYYRYNFVEKQVYFSAYHISPGNVSDYVKGMKKYGIQYMTGYAMSNYFLARLIENGGIKAPKLKAVITSSEKLTEEMRATFERVYQCKAYDSYSGLEACGLISECENGKLHMSPDAGIIELIKTDGSYAGPGETGEAICTGLLNFDQPLIRYRIGDLIQLSHDQSCSCGRNMPVVDEIIGRTEDTVIGKDGRMMVRFHGIFIQLPKIIEGQIIQHTMDQFEVKMVSTSPLTSEEKDLIQKRMESQLGPIELKITETDNIPRNSNGKFKAVISHLK